MRAGGRGVMVVVAVLLATNAFTLFVLLSSQSDGDGSALERDGNCCTRAAVAAEGEERVVVEPGAAGSSVAVDRPSLVASSTSLDSTAPAETTSAAETTAIIESPTFVESSGLQEATARAESTAAVGSAPVVESTAPIGTAGNEGVLPEQRCLLSHGNGISTLMCTSSDAIANEILQSTARKFDLGMVAEPQRATWTVGQLRVIHPFGPPCWLRMESVLKDCPSLRDECLLPVVSRCAAARAKDRLWKSVVVTNEELPLSRNIAIVASGALRGFFGGENGVASMKTIAKQYGTDRTFFFIHVYPDSGWNGPTDAAGIETLIRTAFVEAGIPAHNIRAIMVRDAATNVCKFDAEDVEYCKSNSLAPSLSYCSHWVNFFGRFHELWPKVMQTEQLLSSRFEYVARIRIDSDISSFLTSEVLQSRVGPPQGVAIGIGWRDIGTDYFHDQFWIVSRDIAEAFFRDSHTVTFNNFYAASWGAVAAKVNDAGFNGCYNNQQNTAPEFIVRFLLQSHPSIDKLVDAGDIGFHFCLTRATHGRFCV